MSLPIVVTVLRGVLVMASVTAAVVFARFWKQTRDRLFAAFSAAFGLLALNWLGIALISPADEARTWYYVLRLLAFTLILVAIGDKNRPRGDAPR